MTIKDLSKYEQVIQRDVDFIIDFYMRSTVDTTQVKSVVQLLPKIL